jgi:phosphoserine phosphatase
MVVVFDFDKTLTKQDTLWGFYKCCNPYWYRGFKDVFYLCFSLLHVLKIIDNDRLKKIGILIYLKGKKREELNNYGKQYAKNIVFNDVYHSVFLIKYPDAIIASASYEEYLRPIFTNNKLIASRLEYQHDKVVGLKDNAYAYTKKTMLIKEHINEIDIFYTDSKSDLPVCGLSKNVIWVK